MKKLLYVALLAIGVALMVAPPAMAQEDRPATLHGEIRFRMEQINNGADFDDTTDDGALFFPWRVRISAEKAFTKNVSAWIEFQNAGVAGGDGSPFKTGSDDVQVYQANMTLGELWSKKFSLRIGRQEIVAGNELLLGDLDFYSGISHDGGVGTWKFSKGASLMVWYTRPTEGSVPEGVAQAFPPDLVNLTVTPGGGSTAQFLGGYMTWVWNKDQNFDVYLMSLNDRGLDADFQTLGVRWAHDVAGKNGLFWSAELAQQFGDADSVAGTDAEGRVIEGWLGYNWKTGRNTHRVYGRLGLATGDDGTTPEYEGFIPLFGDFHNRTGRGDWFQLADVTTFLGGGAGGGLTAVGVGYNGFYRDRHEFGGQFWDYTLEQSVGSDDLGAAIDVWYGFNYTRNLAFTASVSRLAPGDALTGGGAAPDDTVQRIYGQARLRF